MNTLTPLLVALSIASQAAEQGPSAVSPGQPRAASAAYRQDGAVGFAVSSVAPSAAYRNRAGFVGQFTDATALTLSAATANVNETATLQLSATATLDDSTRLVADATDVAWSVQSGPIASISASGLATTSVVFQNTAAIAQGMYFGNTGTLALTVLDLNPDNYGTYAGDDLPDFWQFTHFGLNNTNAAPSVDADGDGQNNRVEYLATSTPTDPSSRLTLRIELVPAKPDWRRIVFEPYSTKRVYTLHTSDNLADPLAWQPLTPADEGQVGVEYFFIDDKAVELAKFYRIEISE